MQGAIDQPPDDRADTDGHVILGAESRALVRIGD
jgi:hypothetical protein